MLILALETTGRYGSAAVIDESGKVSASSSSSEMNHLKDIIHLADESISKAGAAKKDITHVAASVGPGSFTGIRIGVTTARTLSQILGLPCISVSSLEAMALRAKAYAEAEGCTYICSIINARRRQTYGGIWKIENGELTEYAEQKQRMIEDILEMAEKLDGRLCFTGDGIDAYESIISEGLKAGTYALASQEIRYQHAAEVAMIAKKKSEAGDVLEYGELLPNYMRLSEAEQRLREGTLSKKISR